MPAVKKVAPRPKRAKEDVQKEFSRIQHEVTAARESADPKHAEAGALREADIRTSVEGVTVEGVVQKLSGLGIEISRSLSDISAKLSDEVQRLASVREAVALERADLERLHKIDVAATALDHLVQDYQRKKEDLEAEIAAQRATWEEEEQQTDRERKETEESLKKQRQRETDDYEYKKGLERKRTQDKYEEEQRLLEKQNKEKQEALQKGWQQREAELKQREEELAKLRKMAEDLPLRIEKEAAQAGERARKDAEQQYQQEILLLKRDAEADKRVAELRIKSLEEMAARQAAQITALEHQLDAAKQQVQDIAVKAIEGASGARALAHVNQIAIEQAKTRPQG